MRIRILLSVLSTFFAFSCKDRQFSGEAANGSGMDRAQKQITESKGNSSQNPTNGGNSSGSDNGNVPSNGGTMNTSPTPTAGVPGVDTGKGGVGQSPPSGLSDNGGKGTAPPNYQTCAALPTFGKMRYPAKCEANHVIAVINDGNFQEMTCCPLVGKDILSTNTSEQYLRRIGRCQSDEVGVGMEAAAGSIIYCTKINSQFLKLTAPVQAIYAKKSSALSPIMAEIAGSYNIKDTCICPERSILIGGHSTEDNVCTDLCVEIVAK